MTETPTPKAQREAERLDERAAIVAWLRKESARYLVGQADDAEAYAGATLAVFASAIEHAAHLVRENITPESGEA